MRVIYVLMVLALIGCSSDRTVRIGNLEVMTEDLGGNMTWDEAVKACEDLGDGWRLPTKTELNILYENREKIGGFAITNYWSSTEYVYSTVWEQNFGLGNQGNFVGKNGPGYVRAVRAF